MLGIGTIVVRCNKFEYLLCYKMLVVKVIIFLYVLFSYLSLLLKLIENSEGAALKRFYLYFNTLFIIYTNEKQFCTRPKIL